MHYEKFADGSVKCIEDEIPFDIPGSWAWVRISSICVINPKNDLNDDTEVSFIPMPHICEGYENRHSFDIRKWSEIKTGYTHFAENDIGIAKITPCFENRKSVVFHNLKNGAGAGTTELFILRPIISVEPDYLLWIAKTDDFINGGVETFSAAVGQQRVDRDFIVNYLIPLPPVNEQKSIINKINVAFSVINTVDQNKADLANTIFYAKSKILDLAIRGQLVPQNPDDEPASVLLERIRAEKEELIKHGKIKRGKKESFIFRGEDNSYYEKVGDKVENISDEIPFELPDGWAFVRLKELCELVSGRDLSPSEYNADGDGIPYITGASNFANGKVSLVRWTTTPQVITKTGDLLLTCKGTIGEMALNNFGDAHIARQVMAIRNTFTLNPEYLALCITAHISAIKNVAKGLIPGISREDILNLILPVPSPNYQAKIVERVAEVTNILSVIEKSLS